MTELEKQMLENPEIAKAYKKAMLSLMLLIFRGI